MDEYSAELFSDPQAGLPDEVPADGDFVGDESPAPRTVIFEDLTLAEALAYLIWRLRRL
jgi:hypothetical protein